MTLLALTVAGCGHPPPKPAAKQQGPKAPSKPVTGATQGLKLVQDDPKTGKRLFEIQSRSSQQSQLKEDATLTDSAITLFQNGVPDMRVAAPNVKVDGRTQDIIMWGGLNGRALREDARFHVDRMTWNAATKKYVGSGNVRYTRGPVEMTARKMSGITPVTKVALDGDVRASLR